MDSLIIFIVYVDGSIMLASPLSILPTTKAQMSEHLEISYLSLAKTFLGLHLKHNRKNKIITIYQTSYITKVLKLEILSFIACLVMEALSDISIQ